MGALAIVLSPTSSLMVRALGNDVNATSAMAPPVSRRPMGAAIFFRIRPLASSSANWYWALGFGGEGRHGQVTGAKLRAPVWAGKD